MPRTIHTSLQGGILIACLISCTPGLFAQLNVELEGVDPICFGLASGSVTSTVSGGILPYTYNWSTDDEDPFIENLTAGEYSLTVTDADGEMGTASITLVEPPLVTLDVSSDQNCSAPFTLTADAGGGVGDFIYNWSTGEETPQIVVNDEIEYCVTVVDGNGCGTFECITPESDPPSVEVVAIDVLCFGDENGSLTATGSEGTPPYSFSWSNGEEGAMISDLAPGIYTVTLTDANGCTATATGTVNEPPLLTTVTTSQHDVCPGEATGSAFTMPSGGTPPYTYLWSTGAVTQGIATLPGGTYSVTVTDDNDCTVVDEITIVELDGPEVSIEGGPVICGDGNTIDLTAVATGGTGNYQFEWSTNEFTQTITVGPGTYSVTVEDGNGCTDETSITITVIDVSIELSSTDILCNGDDNGTATVEVTGGDTPYTFEWSNGDDTPTITGLEPGTYTVTVTEDNGCKAIGSVTISEPPPLEIFGEVSDPLCADENDGSIDITVVGGTQPYTYDWADLAGSDDPEDRENLSPGTYTVVVTDANDCTISATYTIEEPNDIFLDLDVTDVLCNGNETGSIEATATGGTPPYTYDWSDLAGNDDPEDRDDLAAGTYTLTVTDANGCTATASATISEPPALLIDLEASDLICNGDENGSIELTVTGGTALYTYDWADLAGSDDTEDRGNLGAGTYTVVVTDANDCSTSGSVTINEPPAVEVFADETDVLCNGDATGAIEVTAVGGTQPYTYDWADIPGSDDPEDRSNLTAGTYTLEVSDANNCTSTISVTISEPEALDVDGTVTDVLCTGDEVGSIDVTAAGGTPPYTYDWSDLAGNDNPADRDDLGAGTYTVVVTDDNGCTESATFIIEEPNPLSVILDPTDILCNGDETGSIEVTVLGGTPPYTYDWSDIAGSNNEEDRDNLPAGAYTVVVTDANGCTISETTTINEPPALEIDAEATDVLCNGDATGSIEITVFGGTQPYTYDWADIPGDDDPEDRSDLAAGTYTVEVTDDNGCTISITATINEPPALDIDAQVTDVDCNGHETGEIDITVTGGTAPYTYDWSDLAGDDNEEDRDNLAAGNYSVDVTDANGCVIFASYTVEEPPALSLTASVGNVLCNGDTNGSIDVTVGGGTPPYTYDWLDLPGDDNPEDRENLAAGSYTITVIDANDCEQSATLIITEPGAIIVSVGGTDVLCNGEATGTATVTVVGGTEPYSYDWSDLSGDDDPANRDDLSAGTYTVVVTDQAGCTGSATVTILEPPALSCVVEILQQPTMGDNGSLTVIPEGGTSPYSFEWSTGDMTQTIDGLSLGTYSATVTDANGCTTTCSATLDPCILNIEDPGTIGFDQELCGPGNVPNTLVELTPATGGVGTIEYLWMFNTVDPGQDISFWHPIPNSNSVNFSPGPLQQTTFFTRCVRRDDCPYIESNIVTITVGDDAVADIDGPSLGCEGEEITFTSVGSGPSADISWSVTGDGDIIGASDEENLTVVWGSFGVHSVSLTVTENGCTSTTSFTISVVNNPMVCGGNFTANGTVNSVPNRDVTLEWMLPNDGYAMIFAVERSLDGENYESAGQVSDPAEVLGTTAVYEFHDIAPFAGLNYYRVVAYNGFGESMTSNVVEFQLAGPSEEMARIFPNPTTDGMVHLEMLDPDASDEEMTIDFISTTGGLIDSQTLQSGAEYFDLPILGKSAGVYFIRITCGEKVETHRVMINE
ncbi:MAG: T9SS type A sorting domain-containing protein [Bacteroidota bacterium]